MICWYIVDLRSSLGYFMMTHPLPIAGKLPIKTLVARQLPTNTCTHTHTHTHTHTSVSLHYVQPVTSPLPSSDRVAMDDHVRFSGGSDSCSRMDTSGATRERGICWDATVTTWIQDMNRKCTCTCTCKTLLYSGNFEGENFVVYQLYPQKFWGIHNHLYV